MDDVAPASLPVKWISLIAFLTLSLGALVGFAVSVTFLISQITEKPPAIEFNKGNMYLLGIGCGLSCISVLGFLQGILSKKLGKEILSFFNRAIIISLIITFTFPQLAHFAVSRYSQSIGYKVCSEATYRWIGYSELFYTKDDKSCKELIEQKRSH